MRPLSDDPATFAEDALRGFVDAYADQVRLVPGGVVRAAPTPAGKVAVVVGGGSGHYPAFCGLVGEGCADGAVVGNVFTSPSADAVEQVARAAAADAGVLLLTGNYAGDVMNFRLAESRLRAAGVDARYLVVTDDVASAPAGEEDRRRGIAGDLVVFKAAAAAAEAGADLDEVERVAVRANALTRTFGVAFDGCTLPGADEPLFTVPAGRMGIGVGIHGEPGIGEAPVATASELARLLVERLLAEAPSPSTRVAAVLNGLGRTKYEELFVLWGAVAPLLREAGLTVVEPDVGELVTSLDMAGCSLTLAWLDDELERYWRAPSAAPGYRKGRLRRSAHAVPGTAEAAAAAQAGVSAPAGTATGPAEPTPEVAPVASEPARALAARVVAALEAVVAALQDAEAELGRLDAVAGDGDHGRGMVRGTTAARDAARAAAGAGAGAGDVLARAGRAWAGQAGGTSGVLWGAMLEAAAEVLPDRPETWERWAREPVRLVADAVDAAAAALRRLGGAEVGDKTMLDALAPFGAALAADPGAPLAAAWRVAASAARAAAEATADLRPRVGRARPLAERSVGTPDPGATSLALAARAAAEVAS